MTVASEAQGIEEVVVAFEEHYAWLKKQGQLGKRRRRRLEQRLQDLLRDQLWRELETRVPQAEWQAIVQRLADRKLTPHSAASRILALVREAEASLDPL
jgi:putative protein kinase ArgK-like GTPase of G3E family